jgi:hypothetical protein
MDGTTLMTLPLEPYTLENKTMARKKEWQGTQATVASTLYHAIISELARNAVYMQSGTMADIEPLDQLHFAFRVNFGLGQIDMVFGYAAIERAMGNPIEWQNFLKDTAMVIMGQAISMYQVANRLNESEVASKKIKLS